MPGRPQRARVSCADPTNPLEKPPESTTNHTIRRAAACRNTFRLTHPRCPLAGRFVADAACISLASLGAVG
jgi:hypothetical protein